MLNGTHGTAVYSAEQIALSGFRVSKLGFRGRGVYFWSYYDDDLSRIEARELAIAWYQQAKEAGQYERTFQLGRDTASRVLYATISCPTERLLDLSDPQLEIRFNKLIRIHFDKLSENQKFSAERRKRLRSKVYDHAVDELEKTYGLTFAVIHCKLRAPDKRYYQSLAPLEIVDWHPYCVVVKELAGVEINIIGVE